MPLWFKKRFACNQSHDEGCDFAVSMLCSYYQTNLKHISMANTRSYFLQSHEHFGGIVAAKIKTDPSTVLYKAFQLTSH